MSEQLVLYRVEWAANPLASKVFLTDAGRLRLRYGIALDWLGDVRASIDLTKRDNDLKWLDMIDAFEAENVEASIETRAVGCEAWLMENHCGDCTCVPASCSKCYAESMLGFSVTEGLGKHEGHVVQSAFAKHTTLAEAIDWLEHSPIQPTWGTPETWAPHMSRWARERANAAAWLRQYQQQRLLAEPTWRFPSDDIEKMKREQKL